MHWFQIKRYITDMLKAQRIIPQSPIPSPSLDDSPGPLVKVEAGKNKERAVKREREENGNDDVIEIFSDDEDLGSLRVTRTTPHTSTLLTASEPRMSPDSFRNEFCGKNL